MDMADQAKIIISDDAIERFDYAVLDGGFTMLPYSAGEWVRYSDYMALSARRATADVTEIIGYQWRSKLGPAGWEYAEFSINDPRPLPDQFEVREVFAAIKPPTER